MLSLRATAESIQIEFMRSSRYLVRMGVMLFVLGLSLEVSGQTGSVPPSPWALCTVDSLAQWLTQDTGATLRTSSLRFSAERSEVTPERALLSGEVFAELGDLQLRAPELELDRNRNRVRGEQLRFGSPLLAIHSARGEVDLERETAEFEQTEYYFPQRNAQGSAALLQLDRRMQTSRLRDTTYSTCARSEEFWQLRARELELDRSTGRGTARDVTFAIADVPLLYMPYLSFPIDDRRHSGWLVPRAGYDSDRGFDLILPYYWNIAPQQDMTLFPRLLSDRGAMLGAEYRFLGANQRGQVELEYLPDDRILDDDRGAFKIEHAASWRPGLFSSLLYQYVSDDDYLDELGDNIGLLSPRFLERHLALNYRGEVWTALARVQGFQVLDRDLFRDDNEPYDRLPQLRLDGAWPDGRFGLDLGWRSELVRFANPRRPDGTRIDLEARMGWPRQWPAGFIRPDLKYRYTAYDLDRPQPGATTDQPRRGLVTASLDGGLFFERLIDWPVLGAGLQTLEPRFYYLYAPFRDQRDIPLFDTAAVDRNFTWLFLDNRFTGADRIGDANQVTTALTTRFLQTPGGSERLRLSLGQIFYFRDREVTLDPDAEPERASTSGPIIEGRLTLNRQLALQGAYQWDPERDATRRGSVQLRYQPRPDRIVNLAHSYVDDALERVDLSVVWSVNPHWQLLGRWNYALDLERNLNLLLGVEYNDCCWALRVVGSQRRDKPEDTETRNAIYLQLELKGLSSVGRGIDRLLQDTIPGYDTIVRNP